MPVRPRDGRQDWIPLYHIIKKSNSSLKKAFKLMYLTSEIVKFAGGRTPYPLIFHQKFGLIYLYAIEDPVHLQTYIGGMF